jgi:hypothetical protein
MTIEIRIPKTIDTENDVAEWEHYCYISNMNKAFQIIQELFGHQQPTYKEGQQE